MSAFGKVFDGRRRGQNGELKVLTYSARRFTWLGCAGVDGQAGRKLGKVICAFRAKLAKDSDGVEFEELGARGIFHSLLKDIDRAIQLYEADFAACVLHGGNSGLDEAGIYGRFRSEGKDRGDAVLCGSFEDGEPYLFAQPDERGRAERKHSEQRVHDEVIVKEPEPGQLLQGSPDGELAGSCRAMDKDQFHRLCLRRFEPCAWRRARDGDLLFVHIYSDFCEERR